MAFLFGLVFRNELNKPQTALSCHCSNYGGAGERNTYISGQYQSFFLFLFQFCLINPFQNVGSADPEPCNNTSICVCEAVHVSPSRVSVSSAWSFEGKRRPLIGKDLGSLQPEPGIIFKKKGFCKGHVRRSCRLPTESYLRFLYIQEHHNSRN